MTKTPVPELVRLREIGWAEWDPIGLEKSDCPRDEYDRYLLQAVCKFLSGRSADDVADYLEQVAIESMGMGPSTPASVEAARRTAARMQTYLTSISGTNITVRNS